MLLADSMYCLTPLLDQGVRCEGELLDGLDAKHGGWSGEDKGVRLPSHPRRPSASIPNPVPVVTPCFELHVIPITLRYN